MIAVVDYQKGNLLSVERGLRAAGADARITSDATDILRADAIVLPGVGAFADAAATMNELGQMDAIRARVGEGVPFLGICLGLHLMFAEGSEDAPEDAPTRGLGFLPGRVDKMPSEDAAGKFYKVPHVGWNTLMVPAGLRPSEPADAAAACGTRSSRDLGGSRSEVRHAPEIPRISGTAGALADSSATSDYPEVEEDNGAEAFACPLLEGIAPGTYFYFTHSYIAPASAATVAQTEHSVVFPSVVMAAPNVFGTQFHPEKSSDAGARVLRNFVRIAGEGEAR